MPESQSRFLTVALAFFGSVCCSFAECGGEELLDGAVAAIVNSDVLTFSEVREWVEAKEKQAHDTLKGQDLVDKIKKLRCEAIDELIDRRLVLQAFKTQGSSFPDSRRVEDQIEALVRDRFAGDLHAFLRDLASQGYTLEKFRDRLRDSIIVGEERKKVAAEVTTVPEEKIQAYYEAHSADYSRPGGVKPLKEVREEIEKALLQNEQQQHEHEWLRKLRKKAYIKVY